MAKTKKLLTSLITNIMAVFTLAGLLLGSTFAWFSDTATSSNNVIASGSLSVNAYWAEGNESVDTCSWTNLNDGPMFNYDKWEPGYVSAKHVKVANEGNLAFKYKLLITPNGNVSELADVIDVYYFNQATQLTSEMLKTAQPVGTLADLIKDPDGAAYGVLLPDGATSTNDFEVVGSQTVTIALKMRENLSNEYQNKSIGANFDVKIYATQYSYETDSFSSSYDANAKYDIPDKWDGSANIEWFLNNKNATEFTLSTAEDLAGLAELVDGTAAIPSSETDISLPVSFEGKTVKLENNVDLRAYNDIGETVSFSPIGDESAFTGTFDGQGHTIENLYQSGWAFGYEWGSYGSIGLFGEVKDATIKNVNVKGAESLVEGGDVGGIVGSATGTCVFENINITDSVFATYNNGNGGIIGWSGEGNYTFRNINIGEDVVLAGLWGSFDSSIGGLVGQGEPGATYNFDNVNVACRLDVYNDCTASYDYYNYRMCGMLIGRLEETVNVDGTNYPDVTKYNIVCNNVNVTYGDWANYHYCEPTPSNMNGGRGMRVEPGYSYDGLPADYDHSQCVDNHMNLIPFDQIFGGDQIGVKGLKSYDGVNVVYNN